MTAATAIPSPSPHPDDLRIGGPTCLAQVDGWTCTANRNHPEPVHVAHDQDGRVLHTWPAEVALCCPRCGDPGPVSHESGAGTSYHGMRYVIDAEDGERRPDYDGVYDTKSEGGDEFEDDLLCGVCGTRLGLADLVPVGTALDPMWTRPVVAPTPPPPDWEAIVRAIHQVLDGDPDGRPIEWTVGTIEDVALALEASSGLRIRQPGEGIDCPNCDDGWTASTDRREIRAARPCASCAWDLAAEEADERCRECGDTTDDGEGWDGYCGNCADRRETAGAVL